MFCMNYLFYLYTYTSAWKKFFLNNFVVNREIVQHIFWQSLSKSQRALYSPVEFKITENGGTQKIEIFACDKLIIWPNTIWLKLRISGHTVNTKAQESASHSPPCDSLSEEDLSDTQKQCFSLTYQGLNFSSEISKKSKTSVNNISEHK